MRRWDAERRGLKKKRSRRVPKKDQTTKVAFGRAGEARASEYLRGLGWQILGRNVRVGQGEIDIVALDPRFGEVVFVEVKTRRDSDAGDPAEAVDQRKLQAQVVAGNEYMRREKRSEDFRFDIIAITPDTLEHFENVTFP